MKYFFYLIFLCSFIACRDKNHDLNEFIKKTFPDLERGEILIIPNSGCTNCISDAENSVDSLIKVKNFKVVFSQIQSLKALKYRLSQKKIDPTNQNIFIDTADLYINSSADFKELWPFPTKMIVKDKKVVKISKL